MCESPSILAAGGSGLRWGTPGASWAAAGPTIVIARAAAARRRVNVLMAYPPDAESWTEN